MKSSSHSQDAELLRRFVSTFGTWDELIEPTVEVPSELRLSHETAYGEGWVAWRPIALVTPAEAADGLERALPVPLPPLYRELILSYRYLGVDLGRYQLLANPPSEGLDGLREAMFRDQFLFPTLLHHGYIQVGKGSDWNYDPVCFNAAGPRHNGELEVVSLDHEQILCYERIRIMERLAGSFRELVEETIQRAEAADRRVADHGA